MTPEKITQLANHWLRNELYPGRWLRSEKTGLIYVIFKMSYDFIEGEENGWYATYFELLETEKTEPQKVEPMDLYIWVENKQMTLLKSK